MIWCLHGAVGEAADWNILEGRGLRVQKVNLWEKDPIPLWNWAREFNRMVKASGDEAPVVLGYSMGGRLALHAMLADRALWAGGIVISAHTGIQSVRERAKRQESDRAWALKIYEGEWADFLKEWNAQPVFGGGDPPRNRLPLKANARQIARAFQNWTIGSQDALAPQLERLQLPVLWVTGAKDQKFGEIAAAAAAGMPQAEHLAVPGAGHRVPWERTDIFCDAVKQFMQGFGEAKVEKAPAESGEAGTPVQGSNAGIAGKPEESRQA